jgi:hypothetical protein
MHKQRIRRLVVSATLSIVAVALPMVFSVPNMLAQGFTGAVYTLTNQAVGNSVIVFDRAADGTLTLAGSYPTGGTGTGTGPDPLGSQGAVVLDESKRLLFAVSAGSNQVSAFAVDCDRLHLLNTIGSGGTRPISVAVHGGPGVRAECRRNPQYCGLHHRALDQ